MNNPSSTMLHGMLNKKAQIFLTGTFDKATIILVEDLAYRWCCSIHCWATSRSRSSRALMTSTTKGRHTLEYNKECKLLSFYVTKVY